MQTYVFTAKNVVEAADGTICLIVDGDKSKELVEKHQVTGYPTGILFSSTGEEIARYSGYNSVKQVTAFFKKAPR
jgi:thioredoxin-related protein